MSYGHMSSTSIEEQVEHAQQLSENSARDAKALQDQIDRQHPIYEQLEAERAAHATTTAKLEALLNLNK